MADRELTPQETSAIDAYEQSVRGAIRQQASLNTEIERFARLMSPSGVPRGVGQFTQGLVSSTMQLGAFNKMSSEGQARLSGLAKSFGKAVEVGALFLSIMDSIEKKQGQLQRAFGITNVSMSDYYQNLAKGADIGGTAGVQAAEQVVYALAEQRRAGSMNDDQFTKLTETFTTYTLALSQNFPQDFVRMQQDLGMNVEDIATSYERLGYQAAQARIPFEQYKNTVFDVTQRFLTYGVTLNDVQGAFNMFIDDVSKGTITLSEVADMVSKVLQIQTTAGGLQKRAIFSKYVTEGWGEMPAPVKKELEQVSQKWYKTSFQDLSIAQKQFAVGQIKPETYLQAETGVYKMLKERFTPEVLMQVVPTLLSQEMRVYEKRLVPAVETGGAPGGPPPPDELEKYRITMKKIASQNEEWYTFMTKWLLEAKSLFGDLSGTGKGVAAIVASTVAMGIMSGMTPGRGVVGGGGVSRMFEGGGGVGGVSGTTGALSRFATQLGLAATVVGTFSFMLDEIDKAGGLHQLYLDLVYWKDVILGKAGGPEGKISGKVAPEELQVPLLKGLIRSQDIETAQKYIKETPSLKDIPEAKELIDYVAKATQILHRATRAEGIFTPKEQIDAARRTIGALPLPESMGGTGQGGILKGWDATGQAKIPKLDVNINLGEGLKAEIVNDAVSEVATKIRKQ